jgi:hypothetical protein
MTRRLYPTAEELMTRAQESTGLADFGKPTFISGLRRVLESLEEDANLTAEGRGAVVPILVRRLINRLHVEDWFKAHPETEHLPIAGPISITGLPRTGTTALANVMSLDPEFRCLRMWESLTPCPPPIPDLETQDPRRLEYARSLEELMRAHPEQKAMHLYDIDATEEDVELLAFDFKRQELTWPVYGYHEWWRDADMCPAYSHHRRIASLLQSRRPPNLWLFKAPHHMFHLEAFIHAYPGARFVFTHRDPANVVPSYASLVTSLYPPGSNIGLDSHKVGRSIHEHILTGMKRAMAARETLGDHRFFDVYHADMVLNPLGTLRTLYDSLGLELRPEIQAKMIDWVKVNHSGAHGVHSYQAEQFGLSTAQIRSDYDFYIRHFDVPIGREE